MCLVLKEQVGLVRKNWLKWLIFMKTVRRTCRVSTVSFRAQAQRSLEGVCFTLRMWVIHKIRLHRPTHVGRLVVPVRPMAHHVGVGFVVRLDIKPFTVISVEPHRSVYPKKNVVLVETQRLVSTMSKLNQSNAIVSWLKREINPYQFGWGSTGSGQSGH